MSYHEHPEEIAARGRLFPWADSANRFNVSPVVRVIVSNPDLEVARPSRINGANSNYRIPQTFREAPVKKRGREKVREPQPPTPRQQMAMDHATSGMKAAQIAALMGNTVGTIKGLLKEGRKRHREMAGKLIDA